MTEKGKGLYMAMEITNNYSNYATNYADTVKKADNKATTEVKTNNKDKVQEYYEKLCKKFSQINFNTIWSFLYNSNIGNSKKEG